MGWKGVMLFPWSQWIFCHLLQGMQDQTGELEFGSVLIHWFPNLTWWLNGEYLSWRDSTELLSWFWQHPFVCLSLFALSLSSCRSRPVAGVHAFLPRLVLIPAYPQVQGCRESMQSSVGWGMQSRQSSFSCVPQLHWLSCTRTSSSFSFGTALSNRAMEMPADGVFLQNRLACLPYIKVVIFNKYILIPNLPSTSEKYYGDFLTTSSTTWALI